MTKDEIYERAKKLEGHTGLTGNERLWISGLMNEFDHAMKYDKSKAQMILVALKFDELSIISMIGDTLETLKVPNAWEFPKINANRLNNEYSAILNYSNLNEISMGGPVIGLCEIIKNGHDHYFIDQYCGGPAIWNESGLKFAIPIWERSLFHGSYQRIGIFNLESDVIIKFKRRFRVLDLQIFINESIKGIDSPIYQKNLFEIDINIEPIKEIRKLPKAPNRQ